MPDRQTGMLRFFQILKILATRYEISFCATNSDYQRAVYGASAVDSYKEALIGLGVEVSAENQDQFRTVLKTQQFEVLFFEHFDMLLAHVDPSYFRLWQSRARIIVDTVDVEFSRLESRAMVTRRREDYESSQQRKAKELMAYNLADLVIATSPSDKEILRQTGLRTRVEVIPLINPIPALTAPAHDFPPNLIFVGNFGLDANVDGVLYFVQEVLPSIKVKIPNVTLSVVGNSPPTEIRELANGYIEVLGYVPDLAPVYAKSSISIVPIRWGGGLKGKVVEGMAFGLPVVATKKGIEGFGLSPGVNVMLGDTPEAFADGVIKLFNENDLYQKIRCNGWHFVNERFSQTAVEESVCRLFESLNQQKVKQLSWVVKTRLRTSIFLDRHLWWRINSISKRLSGNDARFRS